MQRKRARTLVGPSISSEDYRLVDAISWKSVDKDNMEFVTRASCYQVDALNRMLVSCNLTPRAPSLLASTSGRIRLMGICGRS